MSAIYHVIEVLSDRLPAPGVTAHKYTPCPKPVRPIPPNLPQWDGQPTTAWPACMPPHRHECEMGGEAECAEKCQCVCTCELPKWHTCSGGWANKHGMVPCPEFACFGGGA